MIKIEKGNHKLGEIEIINTEIVRQDNYFTFYLDGVIFPSGKKGYYNRVCNNTGGVVIAPYDEKGNIYLVRIYRHAIRAWSLELPRGFIDSMETPEEAAKRELLEELGATYDNIIPLGSIHTDNSILSTEVQLFKAANIKFVDSCDYNKADEGISRIQCYNSDELKHLVLSGEIKDSYTLCSLLKIQLLNI